MNQHPPAFWSVPPSDLVQQLGTTPQGLTSTEARERLARFGANVLAPKRRTDELALLLARGPVAGRQDAVAPVGRQERAGLAMVRQDRQRGLGQGVDRERSGLRVLGARAGSASGTLPITATSQRLTKIDATEKTSGLSPAAARRASKMAR